MKDNFSIQANQYAQFRPSYPAALFDIVLSLVKNKERAWDCATGNGQVAQVLANYFQQVFATDISKAQLKNAVAKDNIIYKKEVAESSSFPDNFFDLVTVAQAIHWFDFNAFYSEVKRTLKPGGLLAVIGYNLIKTDAGLDAVIGHLYNKILGEYWDKERRYVDENYTTIPFPFEEISAPPFVNSFEWNFEQLIGFLQTWSALQHYKKEHQQDPVILVLDDLKKYWGNAPTRIIEFPIMLRIGQL